MQELGNLGRFTRASLTHDDEDLVVADHLQQLVSVRVDRQTFPGLLDLKAFAIEGRKLLFLFNQP